MGYNKDSKMSRWSNGLGALWKGFSFINEHSLWKYVIIPAILGLALAFGIGIFTFTFIMNYIDGALTGAYNWFIIGTVIKVVANILVIVFSWLFALQLFRILGSIVVLPFLGSLLAQVEKIVTGKSIEVSLSHDIKNAIIGIWIGIKSAILELLILLISFATGPFQVVIMYFVSSYFLGKGMFDYMLEKHSKTLKEREELAKGFKPEIYGLGGAYFFFLMIPIFGALMGPAMAITGAALIFYDEDSSEA